MRIRTVPALFFYCLFFGASVFAQGGTNGHSAGEAAIFEASGGLVFMSQTSATQPRLNLEGADGNLLLDVTPRWGATLDVAFVRNGNVPDTGHGEKIFSGLAGPVFYLVNHPKTGIFLHGLGGMAWVDSAVPVTTTSEFHGYETRFSYALGGGWEHGLSDKFGVRITADYQRTTFVTPTLALQGQKNARITASLVYRFGNR